MQADTKEYRNRHRDHLWKHQQQQAVSQYAPKEDAILAYLHQSPVDTGAPIHGGNVGEFEWRNPNTLHGMH